MIPRIKTGTSFKGAELYYLHDKAPEHAPKAITNARVAWTYTLNCLHDDPELALAEMRHTAFDQPYLKMVSGNRVDGRPTEKPVMTVSLSWSPDQHPSQPEMIDAAQDFLTHMGWQEHQTVLVAHNDTKHAHVHLIINKVHHETGMTLDESWSQKRSQEWGLKFEREQGHVYCLKRIENDRQQGRDGDRDQAFAHYGEWRVATEEMNQKGLFAPENAELATSAEWVSLKKEQREERIAFWKENSELFKQLRKEAYAQVKEEYAQQWHAYEKEAAAIALAIKERQAETNRLCKYYSNQMRSMTGGPVNPSHLEGVKKARAAQDAYAKEMRQALKEQRDKIRTGMRERFEHLSQEALTHLKEDRAEAYQQLLAHQREDKRELRQDQAQGRRRYDLLAAYSRSKANDNDKEGRDEARAPANANLPPFMRTAQIVRELGPESERARQEVRPYLERALDQQPDAQERHERAPSRDAAPAIRERSDGISMAEQIRRAALEIEREKRREKSEWRVHRLGEGDHQQTGRDRGGGRER